MLGGETVERAVAQADRALVVVWLVPALLQHVDEALDALGRCRIVTPTRHLGADLVAEITRRASHSGVSTLVAVERVLQKSSGRLVVARGRLTSN